MSDKFEEAMLVSQDAFGGLEGNVGFELYRQYRDQLLNLLFTQGAQTIYEETSKGFGSFEFEELFDKAYLDNLLVSMLVKVKAPEAYEETIKIVDRYIRPDPRTEGLEYLERTSAGFLSFLLITKCNVSMRQTVSFVSQVFSITTSVVKASYKQIREAYVEGKGENHLFYVLALFWRLNEIKPNLGLLGEIQPGHSRSITELEKVKRAYLSLIEIIFEEYFIEVRIFQEQNEQSILTVIEDVDFSFLSSTAEKQSAETVFYLLLIVFGIRFMPQIMKEPQNYTNLSRE